MRPHYWRLGRPNGFITILFDKKITSTSLTLLMFALVLALFSLTKGTLPLSPNQLLLALQGEGEPMLHTVVMEWRLPRALMAILTGAALGISGAIFQSLLRNPLGSPDVIGFNTGAYTGALITVIILHGSYLQMAIGSLFGGCITAVVIYLLAWKNGVARFRLIIIGIAVSAILNAVNIWLMMSATQESAMSAALWSVGSLNGITWEKSLPTGIICFALTCLCAFLVRPMRLLEMGDDIALAMGANPNRSRAVLLLIATALTAAATAITGPISFIALAAPQIAMRLTKGSSLSLLCSGAMGGLLLLGADFIAQHLFTPTQLPVGIITISIGGLYLIALLLREAKKQPL
jgi:iron complex transport system permease protein